MKSEIEQLGKVCFTIDKEYHNIDRDYDKLVIVESYENKATYASRKPVPRGTSLDNREYWIKFSSLAEHIEQNYNILQQELNELYNKVGVGINFYGDYSTFDFNSSKVITLKFNTVNSFEKASVVKLYQNDTLMDTYTDISEFTKEVTVSSEVTFKVIAKIGNYSFASTWEITTAYNWYIGGGETHQSMMIDANKHSGTDEPISSVQTITVNHTGDYIFICVQKNMILPEITMGGFPIPFDNPYNAIVDRVEYNIYKSANAYTVGTYVIKLGAVTWDNDDVLKNLLASITGFSYTEQEFNERLTIVEEIVGGYNPGSHKTPEVIPTVDEEDLTIGSDNTFKFKNRPNTDGMGSIILRKNKTLEEQLTQENTIYVIQYDFTLSEDITIPANCVLKFDGGSLKNGTIICNRTYIDSEIACFDCNVTGTIKNNECHAIWFNKDSVDYTEGFLRLVALGNSSNTPLFFDKGEYNLGDAVHNTIINVSCDFNNSVIRINNTQPHCMFCFQNGIRHIIPAEDYQLIASIVNDRVKSINKYHGCLIGFQTSEVEIMRDYQYDPSPYDYKFEQFYVDENGYIDQEPFNDEGTGIDVTKITDAYYITAEKPLYIKNLNIEINDGFIGDTPNDIEYRRLGIRILNSLNIEFKNVNYVTDVINSGGNNKYVFFWFNTCYNLTLDNVYSDLTPVADNEIWGNSSYVFSITKVIRLYMNKVRVPEIVSPSWGALGCNWLTDVFVSNCHLNRFDCHYRLNNLTMTDSEIGDKMVAINGYGDVYIDRCKFYGRYAVLIREDRGGFFDGNITVLNSSIENKGNCGIIATGIHDFDFQCASSRFLSLLAKNIVVDNVTINGTGQLVCVVNLYNYNFNSESVFDPLNQIRNLPDINVSNITINTTNAQNGTYVYIHTIYDCFIVNPENTININVNGFYNKLGGSVYGEGVPLLANNTNNESVAQNYNVRGCAVNITGERINCFNTKIRGIYMEDTPTYSYFAGRTSYNIKNSNICGIARANDNCKFKFTNCLVSPSDNSQEKTIYGQIVFDNCTFDVSLTGRHNWYDYVNTNSSINTKQKLFVNNPNVSVQNCMLTDALAGALGAHNKFYDERESVLIDSGIGKPVFAKADNFVEWTDADGNDVACFPIFNLTNLKTLTKQNMAILGETFTATLVGTTIGGVDYVPPTTNLDSNLTVRAANGTNMVKDRDYTYNSTTGEIVILGVGGSGGVTGRFVIIAKGQTV